MKKSILKQILSLWMVLVIIGGLTVVAGSEKVEAAGDSIMFEYDDRSNTSYLRLKSSNMPASIEANDRYEFQAFVDGTETTVRIKFDGNNKNPLIYYASGSGFVNGDPTTSFRIAKGTSFNEIGGDLKPVTNGNTLTVTDTLYLTMEDSAAKKWKVDTWSDVQDVTFGFNRVASDSWKLTSTNLPSDSANNDRYKFMAYIDGVEQEVKLKIEGSSLVPTIYLSGGFTTAPTTSLRIPEGTILTQWMKAGTNVTSGHELKVTDTLYVELVEGTWTVKEYNPFIPQVQDVTFGFNRVASDSWKLTSTNLPSDSADSDRYKFIAYVDGVEQEVKLKIEGSSLVPTIYLSGGFTTAPATSLRIPEGTILTQWMKAGTNVTSGHELKVTDTLYVKLVEGSWTVSTWPEPAPTPEPTEIEFTLVEVTDAHVRLKFVQQPSVVAANERYQFKAIVDGTEVTVNLKMNGLNPFIYSNGFPNGIPQTSFQIAEGTELVQLDDSLQPITDGKKMVVTKNFHIVKSQNGTWSEMSEQAKELTTDITLNRIAEDCVAFVHNGTLANELEDLTRFTGDILINGEKQTVTWQLSGRNLVIWSITDSESLTNVEVTAGIVLTAGNGDTVTISNGLKYVKLDGVWMEDKGQTEVIYNDVQITFDSFDGRGFYVKAEIIAGPDKGKVMKEAYGDWKTTCDGLMIYNETESMEVYWSTASDKLYISGDYDLNTMTSVTLDQGTILVPRIDSQNTTFMRLANTLELEKESVHGRWGVKGVVQTPTEFNDVTVTVKDITGVALSLKATFVDSPNKKVMDVYGDWVHLYGEAVIGDPEKGVYTDGNVVYTLTGEQLILYGIQVGLQDSVEIKAGTILWPDASCKSQTPIRITNSILLTRDAEDEWVITVGDKMVGSGKHSPDTGDKTYVMPYLIMLIMATGICGMVVYKKRRRGKWYEEK